MPDIEIDRRIDFRMVEFHQHVATGNGEMGGAKGEEGRRVEAAHADDFKIRLVGMELKAP